MQSFSLYPLSIASLTACCVLTCDGLISGKYAIFSLSVCSFIMNVSLNLILSVSFFFVCRWFFE